jgi:predicted double-glycine peptidase
MRSLRWHGVIRHTFDYSCGTGSITNLLLLVGQNAPDERKLIERYTALRSPAEVEAAMRSGFSLQDLKLMLDMLGYPSAGVRFEAGTMPEDPHPMIVYLVVKGYKHFAVFVGIEQGLVVLHDPARGRIRLTLPRFLAEWDGSALVLLGAPGEARCLDDSGNLTRAQEAARSALFSH